MGADTKANTRGGGALEGGDLRLLEDSSEHGGALNSDVVAKKTASERRGEDGERGREQPCQGALTERRTLSGGGALEVGDHRLLEDGCERGGALGSDLVITETAHRVEQRWWESERVNGR